MYSGDSQDTYNKTVEHAAWKAGDEEIYTRPRFEHLDKKKLFQKLFLVTFIVVVLTAFILGEIYVF